jgi:hypothetical protein
LNHSDAVAVEKTNQVEEDEMSRACKTTGRGGMHVEFWWESQRERDQ